MKLGPRHFFLSFLTWGLSKAHNSGLWIFAFFLLCFSPLLFVSQPVVAAKLSKITTSALQVSYNDENQDFEFFFTINNKTKKDANLGAILLLRGGKNKRWRGVKLPLVPAKSSLDFSFSLPASFFLKEPFREMVLKVYGGQFKAFADKSSNYQKLTMQFFKNKKSIVLKDSSAGKKQNINFKSSAYKNKRSDRIKGVGVWINGKLVNISGGYVFTELPAPILIALGGNKKVLVNFNRIQGAKSYNLYWSTKPGVTTKNGTQIKGISNNYIHKNLKNGQNYYYIIVAANRQGEGEISDEVAIMPNKKPPKAPPLKLEPGDSKITLKWRPSKKAEGYHVKWTKDKTIKTKNWEVIRNIDPGFEHLGLTNSVTYHYRLFAFTKTGEGKPSSMVSGTPELPKSADIPIGELLAGLKLGDFEAIQPLGSLNLDIADKKIAAAQGLEQAKSLKAMDLAQRDQMIAMFVAQGQSDAILGALSNQLEEEPENLNLSLSLSKVFVEQGNDAAALNVLTASLGRISLSARVALNQELKTSIKKGATTLSNQSEEAFLANEFFRLGLSLLKKKKYESALSAFQSLHSLSPEYPMIEHYLGLSRQGLQQYNQAKEHFFNQANMEDDPKENQLKNLDALAQVMPFSPEIESIQDALERYGELSKSQPLEKTDKVWVSKNEKFLHDLLRKIEKRRKDGLSDLAITLQAPFRLKGLQPGQDIYLGFKVANLGRKPSSEYKVNYILQNDAKMNFEIKDQDRFLPLAVGAEPFEFQKKLTMPANIPAGKYRIIAHVEQVETIGEWTLENNKLTSELNLEVSEPMPDLNLQFVQLEAAQVYAGSNVNFTIKIKNIGAAKSSGYSLEYFMVSDKGRRTQILSRDKFKGLPPKVSAPSVRKSFSLPDLDAGKYKLVAKVTMSKGSEANEDNNISETANALSLIPIGLDLALDFDGGPNSKKLMPGAEFEQEFTINNYGENNSDEFLVKYSLIDDSGTEFPIKKQTSVSALSGKDDDDFDAEFTIPSDLKAGQYKLKASLVLPKGTPDHNSDNNEVISSYSLAIGEATDQQANSFEPESEKKDQLLSKQEEREVYRHLPAVAFTVASAFLSYSERQTYKAKSNSYDAQVSSYASATSSSDLSSIGAKIAQTKSEMDASSAKNNIYDAMVVVGLTWEAYNIFFREDDNESTWGDSLPDGFWKHASTGGLALLTMYQAQTAQSEADDLTQKNQDLENGYQGLTSSDEFSAQEQKIADNKIEIDAALNKAQMYDAITFLVLSLEAYWVYQDLSGAGYVAVDNKGPTFAIRPLPLDLGWNATLQWRW